MESLKFASENEALQHLANLTGKRVKIATDPEDKALDLYEEFLTREAKSGSGLSYLNGIVEDREDPELIAAVVLVLDYLNQSDAAAVKALEEMGAPVPDEIDANTRGHMDDVYENMTTDLVGPNVVVNEMGRQLQRRQQDA